MKSVIVVLDFENTQTNWMERVRSIRMVQNYDCAGRIRPSAGNYADNMLRGNEVSRGNQLTSWQRIPKETPYEKLLKKFVENRKRWLKSSLFIWALLPLIYAIFDLTGNLGTNPQEFMSVISNV